MLDVPIERLSISSSPSPYIPQTPRPRVPSQLVSADSTPVSEVVRNLKRSTLSNDPKAIYRATKKRKEENDAKAQKLQGKTKRLEADQERLDAEMKETLSKLTKEQLTEFVIYNGNIQHEVISDEQGGERRLTPVLEDEDDEDGMSVSAMSLD